MIRPKSHMTTGNLHQINLSRGGAKLPIDSAQVTHLGLQGDTQNNKEHHGGPDRAICIFSLEVIKQLQSQGHPITPGSTGENLTLFDIDWSKVTPGTRLIFESGVTLQITSYTAPCKTIAASFIKGESKRISHKLHPLESRVYAKVLSDGCLSKNETFELHA